MPYKYEAEITVSKRFITVCNETFDGQRYTLCLKATSQTTLYENSKEVMAGCVFYKAGEITYFGSNTAIQPDNPHPIAHKYLIQCHAEGSLTILGTMPPDFHQKLTTAIQASIRLSPERKQNWIIRMGK